MFFMSEEAFNEWLDETSGDYDARCRQTELDALKADHYDPQADVMECFDHGNLIIWDSNGKQLSTCEICDAEVAQYALEAREVAYVAPEDEPPF